MTVGLAFSGATAANAQSSDFSSFLGGSSGVVDSNLAQRLEEASESSHIRWGASITSGAEAVAEGYARQAARGEIPFDEWGQWIYGWDDGRAVEIFQVPEGEVEAWITDLQERDQWDEYGPGFQVGIATSASGDFVYLVEYYVSMGML